MARPLDIRQSIYRYALNQLFVGTGSSVDKILESVDSDLRPHFRMMADGTQTITIESPQLQNPETLCRRTFAPVGGYIEPTFTTGAVTLPAVSGGNIIVSPGSNVPLVVASGNVAKILVCVSANGNLVAKVGREAASLAAAVTPSIPNNSYGIGYIVARNVGGVIQPVGPADLFRFTGQSFASARNNSGFVSWDAGGTHYSISGGQFTLLHGGAGFVQGTYVPWVGPQTTAVLSTNATSYVYIDVNGVIGATTTPSFGLYQNNIVLFEVLFDGTDYFVVKEAHPYDMELETSRYLHDNVGTVISGAGANVARVSTGTGVGVGDRQIKIVGAAVLEDHGLRTSIADSAGAAISWNHFYLNAGGKWVRYAQQTELPMVYNNAGTITALANEPAVASVSIATLYVSKDDFSGTPLYFSVIDSVAYDTVNDAKNAITNGTFQAATNELFNLEVAKLGHAVVVNNASGGYIDEAIIKKDTLQARSTGTSGTLGDHSALNNLLEDTHTQYALLAGRIGGQILVGGQNAGDNLTLRSTSSGTKGSVKVDETTNASSPSTGALVIAGGVGVGSNLHVGQDIISASGQKVDTTAGGTLNLGTGNATTINIGHAAAVVNIYGTRQSVQTTDVEITDKLVLINQGGGATPNSSGFHVERTGGNISLITDTSLASYWKVGLSGAESEIITSAPAQTMTGVKTFTAGTVNLDFSSLVGQNTLSMNAENTFNAFEVKASDSSSANGAVTFNSRVSGMVGGAFTLRPPYEWRHNGVSVGKVAVNNTWAIGATTSAESHRFLGTGGLLLPAGTSAQRPSAENGAVRYNTDLDYFEYYRNSGGVWDGVATRAYALAMAIVMS